MEIHSVYLLKAFIGKNLLSNSFVVWQTIFISLTKEGRNKKSLDQLERLFLFLFWNSFFHQKCVLCKKYFLNKTLLADKMVIDIYGISSKRILFRKQIFFFSITWKTILRPAVMTSNLMFACVFNYYSISIFLFSLVFSQQLTDFLFQTLWKDKSL